MKQLEDVKRFQEKFGHAYLGPARLPDAEMAMFRLRFLAEEVSELGRALGFEVVTVIKPLTEIQTDTLEKRLEDALDALADLDYVVKGTVHQLGLADVFWFAWNRVHNANMKKVPGVKDTRGYAKDVIKPPGWEPPNHADLIVKALVPQEDRPKHGRPARKRDDKHDPGTGEDVV